jgi:molybdopterin-guanine dinucleotide biosynthesis protein MobB
VGYSGAGKTTLVEKLVPELKKKGYRVGTVKHLGHAGDFDTPGKDSWRHFASGADAVISASADQIVMVRKPPNPPGESHAQLTALAGYLADMDVIIVEGYKQAGFPKIEVLRSRENHELLCLKDEKLIAVVTDADLGIPVPVFGLEDAAGLADFIEDRFIRDRAAASV